MVKKRIILLLVSLAILGLLACIPFYNKFVYSRLIAPSYSADAFFQMDHMDLEERKELRFGISYALYRDMVSRFDTSFAKKVIILLPPTQYVHDVHFNDMEIPEPSEFYYFTGVNAVNKNSPNVQKANWALEAIPGHIYMKQIKSQAHMDSLLALYKPYNY